MIIKPKNTLLVLDNVCAYSSNSKQEPIIIYIDSLLNKSNVLKDNLYKSGIYRWINRINNKCYIGSSINLYSRLKNYYSKNYLNNRLLIGNSYIYKALLLYGYKAFNLEILEYCDKNIL